jgi:hypothetical protein
MFVICFNRGVCHDTLLEIMSRVCVDVCVCVCVYRVLSPGTFR